MPKSRGPTELPGPLLDIASYARRGPGEGRFSVGELQVIRSTVRRHPEVMVKVLTRGGGGLKGVAAHLGYVGREGDLALETDDGQEIRTKDEVAGLLEDWNLDVEQSSSGATVPRGAARPKLAHKLVFSMPAGTPPKDVLGAVREFAREEFGAIHRYALVLHTDEPHPHVHLVVKAVGEEGRRLNIRKATLRAWRQRFAAQLLKRGVAANATERAVRGKYAKGLREGVYRSAQRKESWHLNVSKDRPSTPSQTLRETRLRVEQGWAAAVSLLSSEGHRDLATLAQHFVESMPPLRTEQQIRAKPREPELQREHEARSR